jgi:hypothetical protein
VGKVNFIAFDQESGRPTASIVGRPADVADFLAIWLQNAETGISLAQRLGVEFEGWAGRDGRDADG